MQAQNSTPSVPVHTPVVGTEAIPAELRALPRWVVWRYEPDPGGGKPKKPAFTPFSKRPASPTDPTAWKPFEVALRAYERGGYDGLSFGLLPEDGYVLVDLDACRSEDGQLDERAGAIVKALASYTELSPSGNGLHVLVKGELSEGNRTREGVEIWASKHFVTMTGWRLPGAPTQITEANGALTRLYASLAPAHVSYPAPGLRRNVTHQRGERRYDAAQVEGAIREKAGRWVGDDRSRKFASVVWSIYKQFGADVVREHAELIEGLCGEKYGRRLHREVDRVLDKAPPRDEDMPGATTRPSPCDGRGEAPGGRWDGAEPRVSQEPCRLKSATPAPTHQTARQAEDEGDELARLRAENARLQAENERLQGIEVRYRQIERLVLHHEPGDRKAGRIARMLFTAGQKMVLLANWFLEGFPGEQPAHPGRPSYQEKTAACAGVSGNSRVRYQRQFAEAGLQDYKTVAKGEGPNQQEQTYLTTLRAPLPGEELGRPAPSATELRRREAKLRCSHCGSEDVERVKRTTERVTCHECGTVVQEPSGPQDGSTAILARQEPIQPVEGSPALAEPPPAPRAPGVFALSTPDQHRGMDVPTREHCDPVIPIPLQRKIAQQDPTPTAQNCAAGVAVIAKANGHASPAHVPERFPCPKCGAPMTPERQSLGTIWDRCPLHGLYPRDGP